MSKRPKGNGNSDDPNIPLAGYHDLLSVLESAAEHLDTIAGQHRDILGRCEGIVEERSELQDVKDPTDDDFDRLARLAQKLALFEKRAADLENQLRQAEHDLDAALGKSLTALQALWRGFYHFRLQNVKSQIAEQMAAGTGAIVIEGAAVSSKAISAVRALEPTATEPVALLESAQKLLAAVGSESGFAVPPPQSNAPTSDPGASGEPVFELSGPWHDGRTNIQALVDELRREDPSLTLAGVNRALYAKRPDLFKTKAEVLAMNAPLDQPETGVWKAPMIGSTTTQ